MFSAFELREYLSQRNFFSSGKRNPLKDLLAWTTTQAKESNYKSISSMKLITLDQCLDPATLVLK